MMAAPAATDMAVVVQAQIGKTVEEYSSTVFSFIIDLGKRMQRVV